MISARRYFQLSFLLPILLPLPFLALSSPGFRGFGVIVLILWGSLVLGGIPYLIFLAGMLYWSRDKEFKAIRRATFKAPLLFVPVFIYCAIAIIPLQILKTGEVRVESSGVFTFFIFILVLGYFYVLLVNAAFYLLKSLGVVEEEVFWEPVAVSAGKGLGRKRYILLAALSLPFLLIPLATAIKDRERQDYPKRIEEANRNPVAVNRDQDLIEIVFEMAKAGRYEDARRTVASYVEDKDRGFASIVTAQVYNGAFEEAKATVELMGKPESRILSYRQIGPAQAKAGDRAGAVRTLSTARDLIQRLGDASSRRFALLTVAAGQAEAGLDDELKATIELVEPSELAETYKIVASITAEGGRTEQARSYFTEAIKHAKSIKEPMSRDSNLARISDAQADAGLIDDAKATVEMITISGYKESALNHITIMEKRPVNR